MIRIIFGLPRAGKTALMTSFACQDMHLKNAGKDIRECVKLLLKLNKNGFEYELPSNHLVFANYPISLRRGAITSNEVNGYYLGLPNLQHETMFLPPYSHIYLDEAQNFYNSRMSSSFSDFVSRFYEWHGHAKYNITLSVQRAGLIDLNIRELATEILEVVDLKHKFDHGRIVRSTWTCNLFDSSAKVQSYINGGKASHLGERVKYAFDGNIFKHYNSFQYMPVFFKDRYARQFDIIPSKPVPMSLNGFIDFNQTHDYTVPDTYYKSGKKK